MTEIVIKTPSKELHLLIVDNATDLTNFTTKWSKVLEKGLAEGFTEKELQGLVRLEYTQQLESIGVEKPKIRNTINYMLNPEKYKEKNAKAYEKKKVLINQQIYHNNDTEQSSSFEGKDQLLEELSDVRTQLVQAKQDFAKASFEGKSTEDFMIIKRDPQSNNYLAGVRAVEAASLVKSLVESDQKINIGWEIV